MNERTIFLQALERSDAEERSAYLAEACGPDTALRQRVEELLASHESAGSFLGTPAVDPEAAAATPDGAGETQTSAPSDHRVNGDVLEFLTPPESPESLGQLDHYDVLEVVGRGGMGVVLRAFDGKLHRIVALKVMTRDIAGSTAARKRFSREAKAAAAVVHDHIVPIHAIEESGTTPYLVMQFIEGQSLQQMIDAEGSLELKEILRIGMQVASGLAAAHKQGLVHRDIKPSNILLENGVQRVKITDFGLARAIDDVTISQSGIVAGTPQFMSPEQADGQPLDHRSDLFSLGSVLYAMCTGRPPFRAESTVATLKRVCEDTPRPIRELNPDMPEWLCDIIGKLHAKKPAERFQSAKEVAGLLEQYLAGTQLPAISRAPVSAKSNVAVAAAPTPKKKRWLHAVGWTALGLLILGGYARWEIERVRRGEPTIPKAVPAADPAHEAELQRIVDLQAQAVETAKKRTEAGLISVADLVAVEIDYIDACVALAEAQGHGRAVERLLHDLVQRREQQWDFAKLGFEVGRNIAADVDQAEKRVIEARLRLSKKAGAGGDSIEGGWSALFNGKSLQGWTMFPADRKSWTVLDGVLVGHGSPCHLFSERGNLENFHLRMEMRVSTNGAVGQHIRVPLADPGVLLSPFGDGDLYSIKNRRTYGDDPPPDPQPPTYRTKTLSVLGRGGNRDFSTQAIPGGEWFVQDIIADGRYVRFRFRNMKGNLNGTNDMATDGTATRGHIALQLFDEKSTIEIRRIEMKELPSKVKAGAAPLDGRWLAVSAEYQGRQVPENEAKDMFPTEMVIKGTQYGLTWAGKQHEGSLTIDAAKSPAELNFSGSVFAGLTPRKVIYKLVGGRLTLCLPFVGPNADPPRPTEFKTDPQSKNAVLTYRRADSP